MPQRTNTKTGTALAVSDEQLTNAIALVPGSDEDHEALRAMVLAVDAGNLFKPDCPVDMRVAVCAYAKVLGIDAAQGHVTALNFKGQWRIWVGADGMIGIANQFADYLGYELRTLSVEERKELLIDKPLAIEATVFRMGRRPAKAIGSADPKNPLNNNPVERETPYDMAVSRAIRKAVARSFSSAPGAIAAQLRTMSEQGVTLDEVGTKVRHSIATQPEQARLATDLWQGFWVEMNELGVPHDKVHEIVAEAGHDLLDESTGELSMREFKGSPREAHDLVMAWMRENDIEPVIATEPEEAPESPVNPFAWDDSAFSDEQMAAWSAMEVDFLTRIQNADDHDGLTAVAAEIGEETDFPAGSPWIDAIKATYATKQQEIKNAD